jgi:hypothetical protein
MVTGGGGGVGPPVESNLTVRVPLTQGPMTLDPMAPTGSGGNVGSTASLLELTDLDAVVKDL